MMPPLPQIVAPLSVDVVISSASQRWTPHSLLPLRRRHCPSAPLPQNVFMALDPDRIADALAYHVTDARVNLRASQLTRVRPLR